eukprot:COSAG01_NODE_9045_length_2571_cov_2.055016_2_plen_36_part_01
MLQKLIINTFKYKKRMRRVDERQKAIDAEDREAAGM